MTRAAWSRPLSGAGSGVWEHRAVPAPQGKAMGAPSPWRALGGLGGRPTCWTQISFALWLWPGYPALPCSGAWAALRFRQAGSGPAQLPKHPLPFPHCCSSHTTICQDSSRNWHLGVNLTVGRDQDISGVLNREGRPVFLDTRVRVVKLPICPVRTQRSTLRPLSTQNKSLT